MTFSWNDGYQFREKSYLCSSLEVSKEAESRALTLKSANFNKRKQSTGTAHTVGCFAVCMWAFADAEVA